MFYLWRNRIGQIVYNVNNKDSMDKKKQIEEMYADALYNDEPPNVFADRILALFSVVVPKGTLRDETESNKQNSSIATYTENSKPEDYA